MIWFEGLDVIQVHKYLSLDGFRVKISVFFPFEVPSSIILV